MYYSADSTLFIPGLYINGFCKIFDTFIIIIFPLNAPKELWGEGGWPATLQPAPKK
jgi:hypothetical protein